MKPHYPQFFAAGCSLLIAMMFAGCASVPEEPPTEGDFDFPDEQPKTDAEEAATGAVIDGKTVTFDLAPNLALPVSPRFGSLPSRLKLKLAAGSRKAMGDGIIIWMADPAEHGEKKKTAKATFRDDKYIVKALEEARDTAMVTGRPLRVLIDPGHGGDDSGALSWDKKLMESKLNLDIARRVALYLNLAGCETKLTRIADRDFLRLEDRPAVADKWPADVFVSIHLNSNGDSEGRDAHGVETYAIPPVGIRATSSDSPTLTDFEKKNLNLTFNGNGSNAENMALAFCIQRRLKGSTGLADRGVKRARFTVLREAKIPAALVEGGFLSNKGDAAFLEKPDGRERIARGIYHGIIDFATGRIGPGFDPPPVVVPAQAKPETAGK